MNFVFQPQSPASVAIADSADRFPVRRIFCVGRNYAAHAREMGGNPEREPPFFFTKPADAVCDSGTAIAYPPLTTDLHHEVELVVAIGAEGVAVSAEAATALIWGYGVGIDLTRRDLQAKAKAAGRPWDWAKGFDASAPCGPLRPAQREASSARTALSSGRIALTVNGETRQQADLADLIWSVPEIIAQCSAAVVLRPGDLIFTGTPDGVGALQAGDHVTASIDTLPDLQISIA
ncbi:fumarylacetoacetate hydrolase family protein [Pseudohoeflea coraliihabitans]|uniref:Fumarylacetoacetate hydrolase family protein n=1 Tax=Pseudohoeflea coraliihabitans TaxID=2860393 RepID=A0ABS6WLU1_9HYPH|nr:fumarylacetoacetate hydrolase family protein [Pseudohoeflea sp. DP4N28-3]